MPGEQLTKLQTAAPGVVLVTYDDKKDALAKVIDADGFYGAPFPELLHAAQRLRWIQMASAGVETYLFPDLIKSAIEHASEG